MQAFAQLTRNSQRWQNPPSQALRPQGVLPARRRKRHMADAPVPTVLAMLVCDQVIAEQGSGKKSLIGIFDNINSPMFPTQTRLAVYIKLADAQGDYKFRIRLVKLKDETVVADLNADAKITDRTTPTELAINMIGIILPESGKYEFQLWGNETYLHRITLNALQGGFPWPQQPLQPHQ